MDKIIERLFEEIRSYVRLGDRADRSLSVMRQRGDIGSFQWNELQSVRAGADTSASKIREAVTILKGIDDDANTRNISRV